MNSTRTTVLDHDSVQRKLRRIAHQLHEEHVDEQGLLLVGIAPRGHLLAERLAELLRGTSSLEISVVKLTLDKDEPLERPVKLSVDPLSLKEQVVILVDDVVMSGRTLMYAAAYLVAIPPKKLATVVLVDRLHRTFPIRADIVGLTLSTTLQEHISVVLGKQDAVYLN